MKRILGLVLAMTISVHANAADQVANVLETVTEFASAALTDAHNRANDLHAASEDLLYEPSRESRANAKKSFDKSYEAYLQAELYGMVKTGGNSEIQNLINAASIDDCSPDYASDDSVAGVIADKKSYAEITADHIYAAQKSFKGGGTGFGVAYYLLTSGSGEDNERAYEYLMASVELLSRNIDELKKFWSSTDDMTTGDAKANLYRILDAVIRQAERNRALISDPACDDDIVMSQIVVANMSGLYQLWTGEYSGDGYSNISGTGLESVLRNSHSDLAARLNENIRSLFNAARLLGNEKVRRDKDEHLPAFRARTREKLYGLFGHQIELWGQFAALNTQ